MSVMFDVFVIFTGTSRGERAREPGEHGNTHTHTINGNGSVHTDTVVDTDGLKMFYCEKPHTNFLLQTSLMFNLQ